MPMRLGGLALSLELPDPFTQAEGISSQKANLQQPPATASAQPSSAGQEVHRPRRHSRHSAHPQGPTLHAFQCQCSQEGRGQTLPYAEETSMPPPPPQAEALGSWAGLGPPSGVAEAHPRPLIAAGLQGRPSLANRRPCGVGQQRGTHRGTAPPPTQPSEWHWQAGRGMGMGGGAAPSFLPLCSWPL